MNRKKASITSLSLCIFFFLLFILLIVLVRAVDVADIGPGGTRIGLSQMNGAFHELTGVRLTWYRISKWLGLFAIAVAAGFALLGLVQWVCRKSLGKVDKQLLALGGLYLLMAACYLLFELVVINYRPVLLAGETAPEAAFPSSHTMLACVVFGSALWVIGSYLKQKALKVLVWIACCGLLALSVISRLISGVHWLTDILGGLLLSAALICGFLFAKTKLEK